MTNKLQQLSMALLCCFLTACSKPTIAPVTSTSRVLAFGDSLTSGHGASEGMDYPSVLSSLLGTQVINAGESGEDTTQGLRRLPNLLQQHRPNLVILCFGGNDMLRKQPKEQTIANLRNMIEQIRNAGSDIILLAVPKPGIMLSNADFYKDLAKEYDLPIEVDVLEDVLSDNSLKTDPIHPNDAGYRVMAESVARLIQKSSD